MSGIGQLLKETRQKKQLSLDDISRITHIAKHYLEAIEEENWGKLPHLVYVKGYLRLYAECLGLDPEAVEAAFNEQIQSKTTLSNSQKVTKSSSLKWMGLIGILILMVIVGIYLLNSLGSKAFRQNKAKNKAVVQSVNPQSKKEDKKMPVVSQGLEKTTNSHLPQMPLKPIPKKSLSEANNQPINNQPIERPQSKRLLHLKRLVICEAVSHREPQGINVVFKRALPFRLYCFSEVIGAKRPLKIKHLWYCNGKLISAISLAVKSSHWRTWSYKTIRTKGHWRVVVVGPQGQVLGQKDFVVQ